MHERPQSDPNPDPDVSPFELPAIEGLPYEKDSEESRAIRRVLDDAERERAAATGDR